MKRISRSLSNFTSPGSVESFSSGVTTEKRSTCMSSNLTHKEPLWLPSVYKVKLRVIILAGLTITYCLVTIQRASERGLLRFHIFLLQFHRSASWFHDQNNGIAQKSVSWGEIHPFSVGGGFWQIVHTSYSRLQISRHPELSISQHHFHLPSKEILFFQSPSQQKFAWRTDILRNRSTGCPWSLVSKPVSALP